MGKVEVILKVQIFILFESSRKTKKKGEDRDQETGEGHAGNISAFFTPPSLNRVPL